MRPESPPRPPYGQPGGGGGAFVGNTYERRTHGFPHYGRVFTDFSTVWKIFSRFFHAMENIWPIFPRNGKTFREFSTQWKNIFHSVENSGLGLFSGVIGLFDRGCGAKRAAPHVSRNARPTEGPGKTAPDEGGQRTQPRPLRVRRSERPFFSGTRSGVSRAFRRNGGAACGARIYSGGC